MTARRSEKEIAMRRNPWLAAPLLALALAMGAAAEKNHAEVDDGVDVYFRDSDLSALSHQDLETYPADEAGESQRLERAFPDAPPQIPHSVEGMLPITASDNECINCHHPDNAASEADAPIPKSHFQRPVMRSGKQGEPMVWMVEKYADTKDLPGTRYNCTMCHAPQATNVKTPASGFVTLKRTPAE
ncbi:MAG TPA: nitrate reductase cytochrome c-type subunit [Myxococcota bacterium]